MRYLFVLSVVGPVTGLLVLPNFLRRKASKSEYVNKSKLTDSLS